MSLSMTREEREAFLADVHVGVISIEQEGGPPLTVPIWYDYHPDQGVWIVTDPGSLKAKCLAAAGRFSLVAQIEKAPVYQYVSVEGPVVESRPADPEKEVRPMAHRYFGKKLGDAYIAGSGNEGQLFVRMEPERWRTVDYTKMGAA